MKTTASRFISGGFTLVELLVGIVIAAILVTLLLAAIRPSIERGQTIKCVSNLRQIGSAILQYASENNGYLPAPANSANDAVLQWPQAINEYGLFIKKSDALLCPADTDPAKKANGYSYAMNGFLHAGTVKTPEGVTTYIPMRLVAIQRLSQTILFADSIASQTGRATGPQWLVLRHQGRFNAVFLDGHASSLTQEESTAGAWNPALQSQ